MWLLQEPLHFSCIKRVNWARVVSGPFEWPNQAVGSHLWGVTSSPDSSVLPVICDQSPPYLFLMLCFICVTVFPLEVLLGQSLMPGTLPWRWNATVGTFSFLQVSYSSTTFDFPLSSLHLFPPLFLVAYPFLSKEIGLPSTSLSKVLSIISPSLRAGVPVLHATWNWWAPQSPT